MTYINPPAKVLRHADRIALLQVNEIPFPVNVEVDISGRCWLGCEFCHFGYTHTRGPLAVVQEGVEETGDLMDVSLFDRFVGEMKECGVKSITFTGGGDPLTHPDFADFIWVVDDHNLRCGVYTSAVGLKTETICAIRCFCDWVVISLDESDQESYKKLKKVDAFDRACDGVLTLTEDRDEDSQLVVGSSFLLNENNIHKIPEMLKLHEQLKTDYVLFRPTIRYDLKNPSKMVEDPYDWCNKAIQDLWTLRSQGRKDIEFSDSKFDRYRHWERNYPECVANLLTGVVTPNGKMWACVNRRGFPGSCIGDLSKDSFREVWSRQKRRSDYDQCRVACRGDEINVALTPLLQKTIHEEFI